MILKKFWPVIFIFGLWFIFASPYFLKGKVPYASTYQVDFFHPWSMYFEFKGPVKNNAMPDIHTQIYPWKKFTIETFKLGQLPLWDPYNFTGNPHLANLQSAVLSPFNLLFFILPFIDAWSLLILLQPILAGLFMYLLVRSLRVSKVGSLISSVSFMFCGFIVVWMAHGTLAYAILYLPLALWSIEKFFLTRTKRFLAILSLTVPLSFFSGHIQTSFYFLSAVIFYILFKIIVERKLSDGLFLLLAGLLGILFSLPQLIPTLNLYLVSVRSEIVATGGGGTIPFVYFITMIAPDFFGNAVTRNDWFGYYAEWASFVGIWPLFLALLALAKPQKNRLVFVLLGVSALILASSLPLSAVLASLKIPIVSNSAIQRIIVVFSFSFAVLAGFGFDDLIEILSKRKNLKKLIIILSLMLVFLISVWFILFFAKPMPAQWLIVAKRNFILPTMLFLGGAFLIISSFKFKKIIILATLCLLLATSFDSYRFAQKWMPFDPRRLVYPETPIIKVIQANIGDGRIFGNLGGEVAAYYQIPILSGYDSLYISRYGEFTRAKGRSTAGIPPFDPLTDRVLDLTGVSLIYHPIADTNQSWAYPVWKKKDRYEIVYQDDKFLLFKNTKALPRAALFYNYQVISDGKEILKTFYDPSFDFRKILILEKDPGIKPEKGKGEAKILIYTPDYLKIQVKTNQPALLFLADNFYPSWEAKVNGVKTEIFRSDYTFRSVLVPVGESIVEFSMRWF